MSNYCVSCDCKECKEPRSVYITSPAPPAHDAFFTFTCNKCQTENIGQGHEYSLADEVPADAIVGEPN